MTTTGQSNALFKISQHCWDSFFLLRTLPMNQCANSGWQVKRPAAIVRCLSVEDVIHTVRWSTWATAFSSRCRTRDFGRSLRENGVVILSQMRAITIDPVARTGSSWSDGG